MSHRVIMGLTSLVGFAGCVGSSGCAGHARVELAAADAVDSLAAETQKALDEFERDLSESDAARGRDITAAFVARTRRDHADDERMARNEAAFAAALDRLWADRQTAIRRHGRASANVGLLHETAAGLRRMGLDALRLEDDARRYFESLLEARAHAAAREAGADATAATDGSN